MTIDTSSAAAIAGFGDNRPPIDLKIGAALREELTDNHADLVRRKAELLKMADDFDADHATVDDDETSGELAGVITQIMGAAKMSDKVREGVKAPYLEGERIIDGFFIAGIKTPLTKRAEALNAKQTAYQRAKADRIRREAEAAAAKARAEEDARRREAEKAERERLAAERAARKAMDDAAAAEDAKRRAVEAQRRAEAARQAEERARIEREQQAKISASNAAARSRTRGTYAMASLRTTWKFKIVDIAKVPTQYLTVNEPLVNAAIRGDNGLRDIPGLLIFSVEESVNR